MNTKEIIKHLKRKQEAMVPVAEEFYKQAREIERKAQDDITKAGEQLKRMQEEYKAECKAHLGTCDGEKVDLVATLDMLIRLIENKDGIITLHD